uniref:Bbp19-like phage domain-containing protein n=1 Tax=viral metagenome TaxID=1070528 RepID=A0A6M3IUJ0_9ZZZZ
MKDPKRLALYQAYLQIPPVVMEDLEKFCNFKRSTAVLSVVDGKTDPFASLKEEGKRTVYLHILGLQKEPIDIPEDDGLPIFTT